MEISDVKQQIKTGQFDKFYIFHGEEHAVMKIYLGMIAEKAGLEISYVDSLMDVMSGSRTKSLIKNSHLYIIIDDKEFMANEKMWNKFTGLKDDIVIFYYTTTDMRLKFWKNFKDRAVDFGKLSPRILIKYIQKKMPNISEQSCQMLIDACDCDYGRILLELDKVTDYCAATHSIGDENSVIDKFMKDGTIYYKPKDAIFDFVGAFLERDSIKAYNLLEQSKAIGESNLALLSVMYNNVKTLLQVQSSNDYKSLGLNGFAIKNVIKYKNNYSNGELVKIMKLIRSVERGIKVGEIGEPISVDYVLVNVM